MQSLNLAVLPTNHVLSIIGDLNLAVERRTANYGMCTKELQI